LDKPTGAFSDQKRRGKMCSAEAANATATYAARIFKGSINIGRQRAATIE